jgi:VanZ family protein
MTVVWAGLIFYLSTRTFGSPFSVWLLARILGVLHLRVSGTTFDLLQYLMRRGAHLTVYGILAVFIYYSLAGEKQPAWSFRRAVASVAIAGIYSLTDEFHQSFVPGRDGSLLDCGVDTIGALLGAAVIYLSSCLVNPARGEPTSSVGKSR